MGVDMPESDAPTSSGGSRWSYLSLERTVKYEGLSAVPARRQSDRSNSTLSLPGNTFTTRRYNRQLLYPSLN